MKNNSSPGADGFQGEYYRVFTDELAPKLCKLFNYVLSEGNFPASWSEAVITVILKEGKDPLQYNSYRPINLLCVDYKILTEIDQS